MVGLAPSLAAPNYFGTTSIWLAAARLTVIDRLGIDAS